MNWFLAKIVYRIICGDGEHTPQFDEQLRLILAADEMEALQKAREVGKQEEDSFYNKAEKLVLWKFINVSELQRIAQLTDGAELYSCIEEIEDAESYTELVNRRAALLRHHYTHQLLPTL